MGTFFLLTKFQATDIWIKEKNNCTVGELIFQKNIVGPKY